MAPGRKHPWRQYPNDNTEPGTPGSLSRNIYRQQQVIREQSRPSGPAHFVNPVTKVKVEDIACSCETEHGDDDCPVCGLRF